MLCVYSIVDVTHRSCTSPRGLAAMAGVAVTFLSVTLAHVILCLCVARKIVGFLSVTDTYIHIYKLFPRFDAKLELVASR